MFYSFGKNIWVLDWVIEKFGTVLVKDLSFELSYWKVWYSFDKKIRVLDWVIKKFGTVLVTFPLNAYFNFVELPSRVDELMNTFKEIQENSCRPNSNFAKFDSFFLQITSTQERVRGHRNEIFVSLNGFWPLESWPPPPPPSP